MIDGLENLELAWKMEVVTVSLCAEQENKQRLMARGAKQHIRTCKELVKKKMPECLQESQRSNRS